MSARKPSKPAEPWARSDPRQRVRDMLNALKKIERYIRGMDLDRFLDDEKTQDAVVRNLEVASEAARHVPSELSNRHPEIDWAAIRGAGNLYRHDYGYVDALTVWNSATAPSMRRLRALLRKALER